MSVLGWLKGRISRLNGHADPGEQIEKGLVTYSDAFGWGLPTQPDITLKEMVGPQYKGNINPQLAGQIYASSPVVFRCSEIIASYIASTPMRVYTRRTGRKKLKDWTPTDEIFPANILKWVNPRMTQYDLKFRTAMFLSLYENAYIGIEVNDDPATKDEYPYELWPLNPQWTTIITDDKTGLKFVKYKVNGAPSIYFDYDKVIHIPGFSPFDNFYGLLRLNTLEYDLKKERYARQFVTRFFSHNAALSGVLTLNNTGDEEAAKYREQMERLYKGGDRAYRVLVLEKGMQYTVPQTNQAEVNAMPAIHDTEVTTAMVFGVPLALLGINRSERTGEVEQAEELFWNMTLLPMIERITEHFNKKLCMPISSDIEIRFDLKGVLALKRKMLDVARMHVAYGNSGDMTPNEIRSELGLKPYEGDLSDFGDTPFPKWMADNQMQLQEMSLDAAEPGTQSGNGLGKRGGNPASVNGQSPSMSATTAATGQRDQSKSGEAQLIDTSGKKSLSAISSEELQRILKGL